MGSLRVFQDRLSSVSGVPLPAIAYHKRPAMCMEDNISSSVLLQRLGIPRPTNWLWLCLLVLDHDPGIHIRLCGLDNHPAFGLFAAKRSCRSILCTRRDENKLSDDAYKKGLSVRPFSMLTQKTRDIVNDPEGNADASEQGSVENVECLERLTGNDPGSHSGACMFFSGNVRSEELIKRGLRRATEGMEKS